MREMAKVGIKLADGNFYPILDEYGSVGKKLVLTTVCDGQTSAQIDFYRYDEGAAGEYIGSLVVDSLVRKYAGETVIDLRVRSSGDGRIFAEAYETDGAGGTQKLEIDIEGRNVRGMDGDGLDIDGEWSSGVKVAAKRRVSPVVPIVIAAIIFLVAAAVFLFLFLSQGFPQPANVYAEPAVREAVVPPSAAGDAPPSLPESQDSEDFRKAFEPRPAAPDASRKALRTELAP
jgi:hypothetical protein